MCVCVCVCARSPVRLHAASTPRETEALAEGFGGQALLEHPMRLTSSGRGRILVSLVVIMEVGRMGEACGRMVPESGERLFAAEGAAVSFSCWMSVFLFPCSLFCPDLLKNSRGQAEMACSPEPLLS